MTTIDKDREVIGSDVLHEVANLDLGQVERIVKVLIGVNVGNRANGQLYEETEADYDSLTRRLLKHIAAHGVGDNIEGTVEGGKLIRLRLIEPAAADGERYVNVFVIVYQVP